MDTKNYNPDEIDSLITEAGTISDSVGSVVNQIDQQYEAIDSRVRRKFGEMLGLVSKTNRTIREEVPNIDQYKTWLTDTNAEYRSTVANVNALADKAGNGSGMDGSLTDTAVGIGGAGGIGGSIIDGIIDKDPSGTGDADKNKVFNLDPEVIKNLPPETKEVIKAKLEELGFTDEEIEKILNGKVEVSKVDLNYLANKLEAALKADPTLRDKLIQKYGFDIFNADGTVNKDKLALAMIMDGKNDKDDYDLNSFIKVPTDIKDKENAIDKKPGVPRPDDNENNENEITNKRDDFLDQTADKAAEKIKETLSQKHTSTSLGGAAGTDESDALISLEDGLSELTGSVAKTEAILPTSKTEVKKGSFGAVASVAGLGSAIAAAAGGMALANKKKQENEDEENDAEIEYMSEEDKYLNGDDNEDEDNKDWLYGLGIGLTGVGGLAGLIPDDEDEDDEDDDDDNGYYPTFK